MSASRLSDADQTRVQQAIQEQQQVAQVQQAIARLTDRCWDKCMANAKLGNKLDGSDTACIANCANRFLDTSLLLMKRMVEKQQGQL
ncbi:mitochondrial inner membrane translocase subunit Tim 8 [Andalucia godoyi]|uniref:Mitochondrial import inner membrane translocase subunit n=1 Tax=Andalucia godoyi TaxID=505711 RepID=A0A8K0AH14_ANDGO|nr:mitochondrial inner membrane translocase subunit Tim 8 [Andalucia godoyi]|eukprot:ANDGO_06134.mRNA.1 mitochondrial inner membrane translocase subunit Tim 8